MFNIPVAIKKIHAAGSVMLPDTRLSAEFWSGQTEAHPSTRNHVQYSLARGDDDETELK